MAAWEEAAVSTLSHKIVAFLNAEGRIGIAEGRIGIAEGRIGIAEGRIGIAEGYIGIAEGCIGIAEGYINIAEGCIGIAKFNLQRMNRPLAKVPNTPPPTPPRKRGGETKRSFGGVGFKFIDLCKRSNEMLY
ncbi:hypothetical protein [Nostoc sp.]|uniref:hypothetical protein n=1 Tax=Nostoc sp. TaxID=1180 RepID=UPI002FF4FDE8